MWQFHTIDTYKSLLYNTTSNLLNLMIYVDKKHTLRNFRPALLVSFTVNALKFVLPVWPDIDKRNDPGQPIS